MYSNIQTDIKMKKLFCASLLAIAISNQVYAQSENFTMKMKLADGTEAEMPASTVVSWTYENAQSTSGGGASSGDNAVSNGVNHLSGKRIVFIGDSYVANHEHPVEETWHYIMAQNNNMQYYNYGINGTCLVGDANKGNNCYVRLDNITEKPDYLITIAGRNDFNRQMPIEHFKDSLAMYCEKMYNKFPMVKLAFITPWRISTPKSINDASSTYKQQDYIDAIIEVAGKYAIPVFDASRNSSLPFWSETFRSKYTQNNVWNWGYWDFSHLNAEGHLFFLSKGEAFIRSL